MSVTMNTILVTGANSGLGFETCRQLAAESEVKKVILACRSESKAKEAIAQLVGLTKKPSTFFDVVVMDTSDIASCKAAAEQVLKSEDKVDGVILNAGGGLAGNDSKGNPLVHMANLIGHSVFTELLLSSGKIENLTVVVVGSEVARGIPFMSIAPAEFEEPYKADILTHLRGKSSKEFDVDSAYKYTKAIAALYVSSLARKNPNHHIVTTSPGLTAGTNFMKTYMDNRVVEFFLQNIGLPLISFFGMSHTVDKGAERYVDSVFRRNNAKVPSGTFLASKQGGAAGPIEDQTTFAPLFADTKLQDDAYDAVHEFIQNM